MSKTIRVYKPGIALHIFEWAKDKPKFSAADVMVKFGGDRNTANKVLDRMAFTGRLQRIGWNAYRVQHVG